MLELKGFFDAGDIMVGKLFLLTHAFRNAILDSGNLLLNLILKLLTDRFEFFEVSVVVWLKNLSESLQLLNFIRDDSRVNATIC